MYTVDHKTNIVEIKNVSFAYQTNRVLENINLQIHQGDYLGLVGGNGSGKTTLLKIILGLLKPSSGEVYLFGKKISKFKEWHKIGYVPQKVTNFDTGFPATCEEIVLMGRYGRRGLFKRINQEDRQHAQKALEAVGMLPNAKRLIGELSGGQQQRVFIARALSGEPEILFLDEPTVGVEKSVREEFYSLLKKLNEEMRITIVLVTHDIEGVGNSAMHVACIDCTLFFHNSVDDYFLRSHKAAQPHHHA